MDASQSTSPAARRRSRRSPVRAFTIVEVMVAACVMAFAITTAITVMQRAFLSLDTARNLTVASQIMVAELEKVRMQSWTTVSAYPSSSSLSIDSRFENIPNVSSRFSLSRAVVSPATNLLQITFTVTWRNFDGRQLTRSYSTYYARYGIHDFLYNS